MQRGRTREVDWNQSISRSRNLLGDLDRLRSQVGIGEALRFVSPDGGQDRYQIVASKRRRGAGKVQRCANRHTGDTGQRIENRGSREGRSPQTRRAERGPLRVKRD